MTRPNYRVDPFDRINARLRAQQTPSAAQFRRICCFCKKDMGPAGPGFKGDTHGVCEPPCPKAVEMGWDSQ